MSKDYEHDDEKYIPLSYLSDTDDNYCKQCGERLIIIKENHPYGSTIATELLVECPNGCDI